MIANHWYLAYDSNCGVCSGLANEIASISEGRLGLVSLQDPGIQRIVSIGENGENGEF